MHCMAATLAPDAVLHCALAPIFACSDTGRVRLVSGSLMFGIFPNFAGTPKEVNPGFHKLMDIARIMRSFQHVILTVLCIFMLSACRHSSAKNESQTLTIATYNVGVFGKSGTNTTQMIASMMKELGVQVLSMNELDSCTLRHPEYQLKEFADAMGGWNYNFAPAMSYQGGKYGVGTVSDPGLEVTGKHSLTLPKGDGSEQRALAVTVFEDFVFCSTHLDHHSADAQLEQAKLISAWAELFYGDSDKPVFLCGDMNAYPDSETIKLLKRDWTILSPLEFTFSAKNPQKCIDYIMVYKNASGKVKVNGSGIASKFTSGDVAVASDHLPVYVEVALPISDK